PPHLHLPQPVLRRDVPLGQEKFVSGLRVDVRDAPPIAAHLDRAVQAGDLDGPVESRETRARRIAQRRASGDLRRKRRRESERDRDRKSTRLNSSHRTISYAVFCLKKKKKKKKQK